MDLSGVSEEEDDGPEQNEEQQEVRSVAFKFQQIRFLAPNFRFVHSALLLHLEKSSTGRVAKFKNFTATPVAQILSSEPFVSSQHLFLLSNSRRGWSPGRAKRQEPNLYQRIFQTF